MKLSDTQSLILSKASQHEQGLAVAPKTLPAAARNAVFRSMLKNGLLAECAAPREHAGLAWREDADGARIALRITDAGLRAIGVAPDQGAAPDAATVADTAPTTAPEARPAPGEEGTLAAEAAQDAPEAPDEAAHAEALARQDLPLAAPVPPGGTNLRQAAQAVLDAWDEDVDRGALASPIERLRVLLAKPARPAREPGAPRKPRVGTKQERVLAMLHRPEGATVAQIAEATGWAAHTVRGFFAGLKKKGVEVTVLERVRQVGPNKAGAKGSYSVYRAAEHGAALPGGGRLAGRRGAMPVGGIGGGASGGVRHAVGLYRVSTSEQGQSGLGLEAQRAAVRAFAAAQGWALVAEFSDVASGRDDRRPGFQAALARCRQLGVVLVAAWLDRITRRAHTLSQLLEDGHSIRAADMPGADDLMVRIYAAVAQKERELIGERTRAALAAAKARGTVLGGDRGYRPAAGPDSGAAALARRLAAVQAAHRLALEVERLRGEGVSTLQGSARALTSRGVPTPSGTGAWTHTTVARVLARAAA